MEAETTGNMDARQFYNLIVRLRNAQKAYEKNPSTYNRVNKAQYEEQVDREIERVEKVKKEQNDNLQETLWEQ